MNAQTPLTTVFHSRVIVANLDPTQATRIRDLLDMTGTPYEYVSPFISQNSAIAQQAADFLDMNRVDFDKQHAAFVVLPSNADAANSHIRNFLHLN